MSTDHSLGFCHPGNHALVGRDLSRQVGLKPELRANGLSGLKPETAVASSGSTPFAAPLAHPAFQPYQPLIASLGLAHGLPTLDHLNAAVGDQHNARGLRLHFVAPEGRLAARDYERTILETGAIPTRIDTWHDVLNALVWLRYPRLKAALNTAHVAAIDAETGSVRSRRRDALTVFDESGVLVESARPELIELLATRAWQTLFVVQRAEVEAHMRFSVIGHAVLEKLLAPYPGITGKCLGLATTPDREAAAVVAVEKLDTPRALHPMPVQGVPAWDAANNAPGYYDNREVFRPTIEAPSMCVSATHSR